MPGLEEGSQIFCDPFPRKGENYQTGIRLSFCLSVEGFTYQILAPQVTSASLRIQ